MGWQSGKVTPPDAPGRNRLYRYLRRELCEACGRIPRRMKILFINTLILHGGVERLFHELANTFVKGGHKVKFVSIFQNVDVQKYLDPRVQVEYLTKDNKNTHNVGSFKKYICMLRIAKLLRREKPDVIHSANTVVNGMLIVSAILAGQLGKLVISEHGNSIYDIDDVLRKYPPIKRFVVKAIYRFIFLLYRLVPGIVVVSDGVRQSLHEISHIPLGKIKRIYNMVPFEKIHTLVKVAPSHPWLTQKDLPVVINVGRLVAQKNIDLLIRAFADVLKEIPSRLILVGEGDLRPALEATVRSLGIADSVSFAGYTDNPYAYIARADVFVLSSAFEGFPLVLVESMVIGTPIVSVNCKSGPDELIDKEGLGLLTPAGDQAALAEGIKKMLRGEVPVDRKAMEEKTKAFEPKAVAQAYLEYFREVTGSH
ncbi:MAG: glycosyltransferase [Proteobacteria bacterium]|nr:glycosyltransferase [Pseudomonadota bacterium]